MRQRSGKSSQAGYSLLEMMIVVGMAGLTIATIVNFAFHTRLALVRQEGAGDLALRNDRISQNLRATIGQAQLAIVSGGMDYSDLRTLVQKSVIASGAPPPVPFSVSLTAQQGVHQPNLVSPQAGVWGNELMLVTGATPVLFSASSTACTETISADRYQFVYIYLTQMNNGQLLPNGGPPLRLVEWRSQPVISYQSIQPYAAEASCADRFTATAYHLKALGYTVAYDLGNTPNANAFYQIIYPCSGNPLACWTPGVVPATLPESSWAYMDDFDYVESYTCRPGLDLGQITRGYSPSTVSAPSLCSVAYNDLTPSGNPAWEVGGLAGPGGMLNVPQYALPQENGVVGFPGGFEICMVGSPNAREFYIRHVLMLSAATQAQGNGKVFIANEREDDIAVRLDQ